MTEQELRERLADHAGHYELSKRLDAMVLICKAYTASQVAAKDTEITELKASLNQAQQMYTDLLVGTTDAINQLKAENERLQNALLDIESDANAKNACGLPLSVKETLHSARHGLGIISPAPVTEGKFDTTTDFEFRNRPQDTTDILVTEGREVDILDFCDTLCAEKGWNKRYEIGPNVFLKIIESGDHEIWNEDQELTVCEIGKNIIPNDANTWIASVLLGFAHSDWALKNSPKNEDQNV